MEELKKKPNLKRSYEKAFRMTEEMAKEIKEAAEANFISQNSWMLQAIAERLIREKKVRQ
jgi:predicted HicB family RNase H-like nuclease